MLPRASPSSLRGLDEIDGRKAYLLEVTLPGGAGRRIWVDAETFLDVRCDRPSTSPLTKGAAGLGVLPGLSGRGRPADSAHHRNAGSSRRRSVTELAIERIALNPPLPVQAFAKPAVPKQRSSRAIVRVGNRPVAPGASHRSWCAASVKVPARGANEAVKARGVPASPLASWRCVDRCSRGSVGIARRMHLSSWRAGVGSTR